MPTPYVDDQFVTTATTVGLGVSGGVLSLIFGGNNLSTVQKVGCVACGGFVAFVACPLVTVFWPDAPRQMFGVVGFFSGLIGLNLVRGVLMWSNRSERLVPGMIDKRVGIDTSKPEAKP